MVSLIINKNVIFQNRLFAIICIIISATYILSLSERSQLYIQASDLSSVSQSDKTFKTDNSDILH